MDGAFSASYYLLKKTVILYFQNELKAACEMEFLMQSLAYVLHLWNHNRAHILFSAHRCMPTSF